MLMLCAFIWGTAFVAQSAGSGMGAYSFLAGRSWLAVLVLLPTVRAFDALHRRHGAAYGWPKAPADRRHLLTAGLCCGTLLFAASAAQQIGITLNPSTAKAGFLTAMYVVLVPVFGLFLGRRGSARLWLSMVIAVGGLYLLCMKNGFGGIETSDWILLSCAVLFSFQIITVDHFAPQVDGVRLSLLQFFVVAVESTAAALLFENPTLAEFGANWLPLAYCGVMSSGVAYTLQILGQRDVNPAIASLIMCLESVFSALGGWLLLGCAVLFSFQIMAVDHFSPLVDGVRLSLLEFLVTAIESTLAAFLFETPTLADFAANAWPIVFCGVFSSGVAYTLQILGQKDLNPAIASLIMCLESVFSAIGGWLILHQSLSAREGIGCALIFTAVVLAQLPLGKRAESAA